MTQLDKRDGNATTRSSFQRLTSQELKDRELIVAISARMYCTHLDLTKGGSRRHWAVTKKYNV